ncbi:MAG: hypothetical protein M3X11_16635 [Acidobacteriota bacterium]|nr:hypothetical protein [Acidobacteriota bacterium]
MAKAVPKMVSVVYLNEHGQLTVPDEYRRAPGLTADSALVAIQVGNSLLIAPQDEELNAATASLEAAWRNSPMTQAELLQALDETRKEIFREQFGHLFTGEAEEK